MTINTGNSQMTRRSPAGETVYELTVRPSVDELVAAHRAEPWFRRNRRLLALLLGAIPATGIVAWINLEAALLALFCLAWLATELYLTSQSSRRSLKQQDFPQTLWRFWPDRIETSNPWGAVERNYRCVEKCKMQGQFAVLRLAGNFVAFEVERFQSHQAAAEFCRFVDATSKQQKHDDDAIILSDVPLTREINVRFLQSQFEYFERAGQLAALLHRPQPIGFWRSLFLVAIPALTAGWWLIRRDDDSTVSLEYAVIGLMVYVAGLVAGASIARRGLEKLLEEPSHRMPQDVRVRIGDEALVVQTPDSVRRTDWSGVQRALYLNQEIIAIQGIWAGLIVPIPLHPGVLTAQQSRELVDRVNQLASGAGVPTTTQDGPVQFSPNSPTAVTESGNPYQPPRS